MSTINGNDVLTAARNEIVKEETEKAKAALKAVLREELAAEQVLANIRRKRMDLEASIADGSFVR